MSTKFRLMMMSAIVVILVITVSSVVSVSAQDNGSDPEDQVFYACVKKNNGQLRIVDDCSQCLPSEVPISWQYDCSCDITREEFDDLVARVETFEGACPSYLQDCGGQ